MYQSTRGSTPTALRDALLMGLAPDGGLLVPHHAPRLERDLFDAFHPRDFSDSAAAWAATMIPGLDHAEAEIVARASATFDVPLVHLGGDRFVLELHHGPTHAFKDVGARFMAGMIDRLVVGEGGALTVLVATSGDTGGAVASAFDEMPGVQVVLLFPEEGVSTVQRHQMSTRGKNVEAVAVRGTFDDCQSLVKAAFQDQRLRDAVTLTSANSINVGRLLPQSLYYLHAARLLTKQSDRPPTFVVPSGNLGNLCAGLVAWRAGMDACGFVAAANTNRGFVDFLAGDPFEARPSRRTVSNAMDVGAPSNLERIRWMYGGDDTRLRADVRGGWVSDSDTIGTIRSVFDRTGYLLDPHTAVAYTLTERLEDQEGPWIILATAHPAKFPDVVRQAVGREPELPAGLQFPSDVPERVTSMDVNAVALKRLIRERSIA